MLVCVQYMVVYECILALLNCAAFFVDGSSLSNLQVRFSLYITCAHMQHCKTILNDLRDQHSYTIGVRLYNSHTLAQLQHSDTKPCMSSSSHIGCVLRTQMAASCYCTSGPTGYLLDWLHCCKERLWVWLSLCARNGTTWCSLSAERCCRCASNGHGTCYVFGAASCQAH